MPGLLAIIFQQAEAYCPASTISPASSRIIDEAAKSQRLVPTCLNAPTLPATTKAMSRPVLPKFDHLDTHKPCEEPIYLCKFRTPEIPPQPVAMATLPSNLTPIPSNSFLFPDSGV
jgi:hypothetical protein